MSPRRIRSDWHRAESNETRPRNEGKEERTVSLRLDIATIARIEADRIYALVLPEMEDDGTVAVPVSFLERVLTIGQELESFAPTYVKRALDRLQTTAKIRRFRRRAIVEKQSLANVAAAFRIAADSAQGRRP